MSNDIMDAAVRLQEAESLRQSGSLSQAQKRCEVILKEHPDYYAALHTLGLIFADRGKLSSALFYLTQAHAYYPENASTLIALGTVYFQLGTRDLAIQVLEKAAKLTHNEPLLLMTLAETLKDDTEYEAAIEAYRNTLRIDPSWKEASLGLSNTYQAIGQHNLSRDILVELMHRGELSLPVASGLASLPILPPEVDFNALMAHLSAEEKQLTGLAKIRLQFLYFSCHHKSAQYPEAWDRLVQANTSKLKTIEKERKTNKQWQEESFRATKAYQEKPCNLDCPTTSLFILGASRSGKTSVEALACMSTGFKRGYENPIAINAVKRAFRKAGLVSSTQYNLLPEQLNESCRDFYTEELARRAQGASVFTNTAPSRIHDAFRMITMFPKVKMLFVRRNHEDLAARIFAKEYKSGNFYAYDLEDIREHIIWYDSMITLLCEKYPENTAVVQYEQVASNPECLNAPLEQLTGIKPNIVAKHIGNDVGFAQPYHQHLLGLFK